MFKKVLIVDDHDAISKSVHQVLTACNVKTIDTAQYCDDAFLKVKRAALDGNDYNLVITDLSFKKDHRNASFESGEDLIAALRKDFPELPIIVYSMNDHLQKVRALVNQHTVNAYVCKDRKGSIQLEEAIKMVAQKKRYLSPQVAQAMSPKSDMEIYDYDIQLLKLLSNGLSQEDISHQFKTNAIRPNSLSTIEKRLNKLRIQFKANNAIHLVAIVKDLGLI
ncbi:response regulator [Winogradskyella ludwigii]|jgi:DNA-binding NarL/FixJ family response regulator|uniref:response regulator n=1 Tax=Winogradskyella ludwigii TaxID=2686076 RepID=UPI0015CA5944|nr:response regulator [Winogradskyella ludwigii]